jgi:hypothetical protein
VPGYRDYAVSLTKDGRSLLESHRDHDHSQTFYAGLGRERELAALSRCPRRERGAFGLLLLSRVEPAPLDQRRRGSGGRNGGLAEELWR